MEGKEGFGVVEEVLGFQFATVLPCTDWSTKTSRIADRNRRRRTTQVVDGTDDGARVEGDRQQDLFAVAREHTAVQPGLAPDFERPGLVERSGERDTCSVCSECNAEERRTQGVDLSWPDRPQL